MTGTIAVVDDERNVLTSVQHALELAEFNVRVYTDPFAGLQDIIKNPHDLAILDIKMPRMDGLELLHRLRRKTDLPIIFLTSKGQEEDELEGLRHGADDYISKPYSLKLLVGRVHAIMRRNSNFQPIGELKKIREIKLEPALERGSLVMDTVSHSCMWNGANVVLTVTEFLLLKVLAKMPGHVKTRDQLMDAAYDEATCVDDRTIDSHIKRIRKKFKAIDSEFDQIDTLYGVGYRFKKD